MNWKIVFIIIAIAMLLKSVDTWVNYRRVKKMFGHAIPAELIRGSAVIEMYVFPAIAIALLAGAFL